MKGKKTGGRQAGTANKITTISKDIIAELLSGYKASGLMDADFLALKPKDRMQISEKLMQYILPRVQSVAIDINSAQNNITIEEQLAQLSQDPTSSI